MSTATVSHVINKSRFVSEEVGRRVEAAIKKLGYVANSNARGLRSSVSHRIGLIVPEVSDYFPVNIIEPMESVLNRAGYQLIIGYTHDSIETERRQVEFFTYQKIDGLLLYPAIGDHSYLDAMRLDYPVVLLDRTADNFAADCVCADDEAAVYGAVSLLAEAGYRSIAILIGDERISTSRTRSLAYARVLEERGIAFDPRLVKRGCATHQISYDMTGELLDECRPEALFATNIGMTIGALKCLLERGMRLPGDIAMLGWGDSKWTELTNPPLSVLRHPNQAMGAKAAKVLLQRIKKTGGPVREYRLPVEMVRRDSF